MSSRFSPFFSVSSSDVMRIPLKSPVSVAFFEALPRPFLELNVWISGKFGFQTFVAKMLDFVSWKILFEELRWILCMRCAPNKSNQRRIIRKKFLTRWFLQIQRSYGRVIIYSKSDL